MTKVDIFHELMKMKWYEIEVVSFKRLSNGPSMKGKNFFLVCVLSTAI